jgi:rhombotail lipoprotein
MRHAACLALFALLATTACNSIEVRKSTSALDFLYPQGTPAIEPQDVHVQVPVRVALAFAPGDVTRHERTNTEFGWRLPQDTLTEVQRAAVLERIAVSLRAHDYVEGVDVIPSSYMREGGSFENLDQIARAFGSDVAVLVSYDQSQFSDTNEWSLTYWTIVGAYFVKGEDNQTQTFVDAVVYDIPSRALLFRAAGTATSGSSASIIDTPTRLREESAAGFEAATTELVASLDAALKEFGAQAARGSVRGQGTPAIEVTATDEYHGVAKFENGHYVGALGKEALVAALLLLGGAAGARRARNAG